MNKDPQQKPGDDCEGNTRQGTDSVRSDIHVDGYTGPRARMVLDGSGSPPDRDHSSSTDDSKVGVFERIVIIGLALLAIVSILASLLILPFVLVGYQAYTLLRKMGARKQETSRYVILGTEGSYTVKDVEAREFVAKGIPTMDSARKILKIFRSHTPRTEE